jgi:transglutaminase-like putative cysteine protease
MYYRNGYSITPSTRKHKKYDVYKGDKYITSFGDVRYEHYYDKFGTYSNLDHLDPDRRRLYRQRHANDNIYDPNYAGYWSWKYLW